MKKLILGFLLCVVIYAQGMQNPAGIEMQSMPAQLYCVEVLDWDRQVGTGLTTQLADTDLQRLEQRVANHHKRQAFRACVAAVGVAAFTGGMMGLFVWLDHLKHQ